LNAIFAMQLGKVDQISLISTAMFYAFDVLVRRGEDLMKQTLSKRREILATNGLKGHTE
jgi:ATP-dependent DNA ligase